MREAPSPIVKTFNASATGNQKLSRYRRLKRCVDEEGNSYIESQNKMVLKESQADTLYIVEPGYENRLDSISYKFYGTPFLWWAIAIINHIDNPFFVESGVVLRIPPLSNIPV